MKINLVVNLLGHNFFFGIGTGMSKDDEDQESVVTPHHVVLATDRGRVGFVPNDEEWDDDNDDD